MCQIVGRACCFEILRSPLYFCRRTFPRAFGGGISKAKFLFGHSLDVIDLTDRMGREPLPDPCRGFPYLGSLSPLLRARRVPVTTFSTCPVGRKLLQHKHRAEVEVLVVSQNPVSGGDNLKKIR